jgi:uncharacterized repeat protein (TIGR01451 family)
MLYPDLKPLSRFCLSIALVSVVSSLAVAQGPTLVVHSEVKHDVSQPLRDLAKGARQSAPRQEAEEEEIRLIPLPPGFKPADVPDPVLQPPFAADVTSAGAPPAAPTLGLNFDGIGQGVPAGFSDCCAPPDTNGAVGLTQYVQWVNLSLAVFDKSTGKMLPNYPVLGNTLWKGFGGACETNNDGDPVVVYDKLADRWVLSQLVVRGPAGGFGPFFQCVAVSTTSDATGSYNRYQFPYTNFDDYPKMGAWPDAYYETFNMFNSSGTAFLGADVCAYDRNAMLQGQAATQVCFQQASTVEGLLPADLDGHTPPPPGSPNYIVGFDVNSLNLYKFHVDFATPSNSTFTATNIPVAPFTPLCNGGRGCVPQQGTTTMLDSLADRVMYRLAYRNFGDHESLVLNHSVAVTVNGAPTSGVRWYEIQNPGGTPTVAQQSTFAPDANFRWMGSIAMDQVGDIAVGYSVSSSTMFPSIAVAARLASDPPNTLQTPEISVMAGTGSQTNFLTRWGDYSAMQVDPVDDCTFWYTTEYLKSTGSFNWNTRINSFKFDGCDKPDLTIAVTHSGNFTQGQTGKTYTISVKNSGGRPTNGTVTVVDTVPAGLTAKALSGTNWTCTLGTLTCTRSDALAPKASYEDITLTVDVSGSAPGLVTNTATVSGGAEQNTSNDTADDVTTIIQTGPDPAIAKTHSGSFVQGQTGTYTITVTNAGLSPLDGTTVTVTDTLPTGLTFNAVSATGWSCNATSPVICTRNEALASNASYPPITLTVNVANNAPVGTAINTATVAGGGDVNTLNDTANDPTKIIPPPPDLSITKTHVGNFNQGQSFVPYTLTVSNAGGTSPTSGLVTVTDVLPAGLSVAFISNFPWQCAINGNTVTCTRSDALSPGSSYSAINIFVNVDNNAPASVDNTATVSGGGDVTPGNNTATDHTIINPSPDLAITKSHTPDPFIAGMTGTYTIVVSNVGHADTSGQVSVTDSLPTGLTATAISGTGWSCSTPSTFVNCSRSDVLHTGSSYPGIAVTVSVTGGGPGVTNTANVSGGGEFNTLNDSANDFTNITAPVLAITKSHVGNFTAGQNGAYTITVTNTGPIATIGTTVTVSDSLPFGLTGTAVNAPGWTCGSFPTTFLNCTRTDAVAANNAYPPINLTVAVSGNVSGTVINFASVTGGGDTNARSANDPTTIVPPVQIVPSGPTFVTVSAGSPGAFTFAANLATGSSVGTVSFNLSGALPQNTKATFSPATVTQTGPVTLTIDTSGNGHVASAAPLSVGPGRVVVVFAALLLPLFLWTTKTKKGWDSGSRRLRAFILAGTMCISGLLLLAALSGCGSGHVTPLPPPPVVTPPGTYFMTVTATSSVNGVPPSTMNITLTVH